MISDTDINITLGQLTQFATPPRLNLGRRFLDIANKVRHFDDVDIQRLSVSTACLNDVCINDGAALLQRRFASLHPHVTSYAILSTHDIPRIRSTCHDSELWRFVSPTEYWDKPGWIIPIHRVNPDHWVLCIIIPGQRQLFLFDSFAEQQPWERDVKVCNNMSCFVIILIQTVHRISWSSSLEWSFLPISMIIHSISSWRTGSHNQFL